MLQRSEVWKLPDKLAWRLSSKGSFDCVTARFAEGNYAHDDKLAMTRKEHQAGLITNSSAETIARPAEK